MARRTEIQKLNDMARSCEAMETSQRGGDMEIFLAVRKARQSIEEAKAMYIKKKNRKIKSRSKET